MTGMRDALADYLRVRRALGFRLDRAENLLGSFLTHLDARQAVTITIEDAVAWAIAPGRSPWWHANRLSAVRQFARYLKTVDDSVQVPPPGLIPHTGHRATPYLYSAAEIQALIEAAARRPSPACAATYPALISVLAVTGIRFGEALMLDTGDFDTGTGILTVRDGKFGKSRLLPLHPSSSDGLSRYLQRRSQVLDSSQLTDSGALFISSAGTRLDRGRAQRTWRQIRDDAGLLPRSGNCRPRMHDLRHSFAVASLLDWYRSGQDVPAMLPKLATYMGHSDPAHTFWYLSAAPELLALAGDRLETFLKGRNP
jgi:integrase/recombinase XerD